jgi:hypothetical protein
LNFRQSGKSAHVGTVLAKRLPCAVWAIGPDLRFSNAAHAPFLPNKKPTCWPLEGR